MGNPLIQFGAGPPVQVPSSSIAVDPPPIQANPARARSRVTVTRGRVCGPHQEWDPKTKQCVPKVQRMATRFTIRGVAQNPVSVGACFPKFDPMHGVGQPPQQPTGQFTGGGSHVAVNQTVPNQVPGIDATTGLPRLRGSRWLRR